MDGRPLAGGAGGTGGRVRGGMGGGTETRGPPPVDGGGVLTTDLVLGAAEGPADCAMEGRLGLDMFTEGRVADGTDAFSDDPSVVRVDVFAAGSGVDFEDAAAFDLAAAVFVFRVADCAPFSPDAGFFFFVVFCFMCQKSCD